MISYGPIVDAQGRVYRYVSTDGMKWKKELVGKIDERGSIDFGTQQEVEFFAKEETQAWLQSEPDYTKRIVTPLNSKRTKRRCDVTLLKVTVP